MSIGTVLRTPASLLLAASATLSLVVGQWLERTRWLPWRYLLDASPETPEMAPLQGLQVNIHASQTMPDLYSLTVKNAGRHTLRHLHLLYEPILLDAENFGVDTTNMSRQQARPAGYPIHIHRLEPGQTLHFFRKGWAEAYRYEGLRKSVMEVHLEPDAESPGAEAHAWCYAQVDLPNATH